jgi:hypothetical protein
MINNHMVMNKIPTIKISKTIKFNMLLLKINNQIKNLKSIKNQSRRKANKINQLLLDLIYRIINLKIHKIIKDNILERPEISI